MSAEANLSVKDKVKPFLLIGAAVIGIEINQLLGETVLFLYGVIPRLQEEAVFGHVYAGYGCIFIVLSIWWGWAVDGWRPDCYDAVGAERVPA